MAETVESRPGLTVRDLLDAGLHFGHQTKRWNPKMKRYIFDKRNGIHIIDLTKTAVLLKEALAFVYDTVTSGKAVLFVGTKKQAQQVIQETATACGQPFVVNRWLGGTLTNATTIRNSIKRMREVEGIVKADSFASMHKKEASRLRNELEKLQRNLGGIANMGQLPGAVFIVDINSEAIAVAEANRLGIPVVAIVDTCCNPDPVKYVIPGNDDSIRAIRIVAGAIAETVKTAAAEYSQVAVELAKKREADIAARVASGETDAADKEKAKTGEGAQRRPRKPDDRGPGRKPGPDRRGGPRTPRAGAKPGTKPATKAAANKPAAEDKPAEATTAETKAETKTEKK